jgi:Domain of Unknown Function (DUF1206)
MNGISAGPARAVAGTMGAAREVAPWIVRLARVGYASKAVVYFTVGILAAQAAFGSGGETTGKSGALRTIVQQPMGRALLAIIALGLFGYAVWRVVAAVTDAEHKGSDGKGMAVRVGMVVRALLYGALGVEALRLVTGSGSGGGDQGTQHWTARLLAMPMGRTLVLLAGAGVIAYALYQLYRAYAAKLSKELDLSPLTPDAATWVVRLSRFGMAARGVVFTIIGWFLLRAGMQRDASEAGGLGEALATLERQAYGPWLLGAVALGLIAYAVYELVNARYRRISMA